MVRGRIARIALAGLAFAAVTLATYRIAQPRMFTDFAAFDDEGYMLIALKGFLAHGELYDRVFSQYGPFYYEAWGGLFSIFGIPVDHDSGRWVVVGVWVVTSLMLGLVATRLTGSLLLGLLVQMLVFAALLVLAAEPMHPGGLICLLLAAILVIACCVRDRVSPYALAALGGAVAALMLVKVNVGFFALAAVALACTVSYPALSRRRWLRPIIEFGFVAVPAVLMLGKLGEPWAREYALHVTAAALAVVIVLRAREAERRPSEELVWLAGGFLALGFVVCLTIIAAGTSPGGLLNGVLVQPLGQADAFSLPLSLAHRLWGVDLLALVGALAYWYASTRRQGPPSGAWLATISLLGVGVGLAMGLSVAGKSFPFDPGSFVGYPLSMLAFCWVALVAPPFRPDISFARLLLPLLAVLQSLHGFPVAGSQVLWSAFLLVPVGALCLADGVRGLHAALAPSGPERHALVAFAAAGAVVMTWFVANATLREPHRDLRGAYDTSVSLGLRGAESIRVDAAEAELYGAISEAIERNCPAFITLPGMNSFYLWTGQDPPTGGNATAWTELFDAERQRRIVAEVKSIDGLCLLENEVLALGWSGSAISSGPLVRFMHREFTPLLQIGDYRLLRRGGSAGASSVSG
jgi:hypothetical protein